MISGLESHTGETESLDAFLLVWSPLFLRSHFYQVEEMVSSLDKVVGGQMEKFIKESPFISVIGDESIDIACSRNS